jgi:predicted nuclease with TOPRIM domain
MRSVIAIVLLCTVLVACGDSSLKAELEETKQEYQETKAEIDKITADLTAAKNDAQAKLAEVQARSQELQTCLEKAESERNMSKKLVDSLGDDLGDAKTELNACEEKLETVEGLEAVVADAARRLCCVKRVDDPSIDSYAITDDRINCVAGGEKKIAC